MSSRNNQERFGSGLEGKPLGSPADAGSQTPPQPAGNSGLSFVVPTEVVEIPSKGIFYPEGHPLCGSEAIEIKHMTAKEEDILTSKTLLKKGLALDRMIQSIVVDKSINTANLLSGDRNAIMMAARASAYGEDYTASVSCPSCGEQQNHEFNLSEISCLPLDRHASLENVSKLPNNNFEILLPRTGVKVEVKVMTGKDEKELLKMVEKRKREKLSESMLTQQMSIYIVAVNGDMNKITINKFIQVMPAFDSRYMRTIYKTITPDIDSTQEFTCEFCDHVAELEVPFTTEFFWPKS